MRDGAPGFFSDVLGALAGRGAFVAGFSLAVLHGTTVVVLTVPAGAGPAGHLGAHVRRELAGTDDVQVPVDLDGRGPSRLACGDGCGCGSGVPGPAQRARARPTAATAAGARAR